MLIKKSVLDWNGRLHGNMRHQSHRLEIPAICNNYGFIKYPEMKNRDYLIKSDFQPRPRIIVCTVAMFFPYLRNYYLSSKIQRYRGRVATKTVDSFN